MEQQYKAVLAGASTDRKNDHHHFALICAWTDNGLGDQVDQVDTRIGYAALDIEQVQEEVADLLSEKGWALRGSWEETGGDYYIDVEDLRDVGEDDEEESEEDKAIEAPTARAGHVREVLESPAQDPVLYLDHEGHLEVGPSAETNHHQIVLAREDIFDHFDAGDDEERERLHRRFDDDFDAVREELAELVSEVQDKVTEIIE